jgi:hypothetical protein
MKLKTLIENFVTELQSINSSIILDPLLIKNIINTIFPEDGENIISIDNDIGLDWGDESSPIQYELDFEEHYGDEKSARSGLFIRLYLAATYDQFTLENAVEWSNEIKEFLYSTRAGNGHIASDYFLKTIKEFNKNIPEDLKLYLELM